MMMQPNFQTMTKKELRSYLLAHPDKDGAFYAYADKVYESLATIEAAVSEWLKQQNPHHVIAKVPEKSLMFVMTDEAGNSRWVKVQPMKSSLATSQILIDVTIQDTIGNKQSDNSSVMVVFVSKNERDGMELDRELDRVNFYSRTKCGRAIGYIELDGQFQTI